MKPRISWLAGLWLALLAATALGTCGDGIVDPGEECDAPGNSCCTASCTLVADGTPCGTVGGACDAGVCVTPLALTFVRIRPSKTGRSSGSVVLIGDFVTGPPADVFSAANGVTLHVRDAAAVDRVVAWDPGNCVTFRSSGIRCTRPAGIPNKIRADLGPDGRSWHFVVRLKNLDLTPPFAGPVSVRIGSHSGVDRAGSQAACTTTHGTLNCRAPC